MRAFFKSPGLKAWASAECWVRERHTTMTTANRDPIALNFSTSWTYAPAPESAGHAKIAPRYDLFIDGQFIPPAKGEYFDTINPATEKKLGEVASATGEDVDKAVKAARRAYDKTWSRMPAKERGKYIYRIARMIQDRARELAVIELIDGGKHISAKSDVYII